mmetsp:Transcript_29245/g.91126  ORF Transcript_29245/g.91126 Transcript_29245/m.91126 type:complete len:222 (+) Transcript_29245:111-776(+)
MPSMHRPSPRGGRAPDSPPLCPERSQKRALEVVVELHRRLRSWRARSRRRDAEGGREEAVEVARVELGGDLLEAALVLRVHEGLGEGELADPRHLHELSLQRLVLRRRLVQLHEDLADGQAPLLQAAPEHVALRALLQGEDRHGPLLRPAPHRRGGDAELPLEEAVEGAPLGLQHDLPEAALVSPVSEDLGEGEALTRMGRERLLQRRVLGVRLVPLDKYR